MRLRGIVFERYAPFERVEVDFCDEHGVPLDVVLFVGESARGKTALLRGISSVLAEAAGAESDLGPEAVRRDTSGGARCRVVFDDIVDGEPLKVMAEKEIGAPIRGLPAEAFERWRGALAADEAPRAAFSVPEDGSRGEPEDDEGDPLFDWFFGLRGGPAWEGALRAIDRVLWPATFNHVTPDGDIIFAGAPERGLAPASELGDGFESVLVLTLELLRLSTERPADSLVYVIDDIDAHLHPRWQARLLGDLRRAFPRVQLIATTQSPWLVASVEPSQVFRLDGPDGVVRVSDRIERTASVTRVTDVAFGAPELVGPAWVNTPPLAVRRDVLQMLASDLPRGAVVYVLPEAVHTRDVRDAFGELVLTTPDQGPGYLFFIDLEPRSPWGHACEYVFRLRDGRLHRQHATWPPKPFDKFIAITRG